MKAVATPPATRPRTPFMNESMPSSIRDDSYESLVLEESLSSSSVSDSTPKKRLFIDTSVAKRKMGSTKLDGSEDHALKRRNSCNSLSISFDTLSEEIGSNLFPDSTFMTPHDQIVRSPKSPCHSPFRMSPPMISPINSDVANTNPFLQDNVASKSAMESSICIRQPGATSRYLSDFQEVREIGRGEFGHVYECIHRLDGMHYAVKVLNLHDGRIKARVVLQEVYSMAAASNRGDASSHIVRYFTAWCEEKSVYLQTELCDYSLASVYEEFTTEISLLMLLRQLLKGLAYLHSQNIVHLDIKPDNIMVHDGIFKIGDMGLATYSTGSLYVSEGDGRYSAPELSYDDYRLLPAADIFSLAAMIYEIAIGEALPMNGVGYQRIREDDIPEGPRFSPDFWTLLRSMMRRDPVQRPSAEELLACPLVRSATGHGSAFAVAPKPRPAPSPSTSPYLCGFASPERDLERHPGEIGVGPQRGSPGAPRRDPPPSHALHPQAGLPPPPRLLAAAPLKRSGVAAHGPRGAGGRASVGARTAAGGGPFRGRGAGRRAGIEGEQVREEPRQTGRQVLLCGSLDYHYPPRVFLIGPHWPLSLVVLALIAVPNGSIFLSCRASSVGSVGILLFFLATLTFYLVLVFGNPGVVKQNLSQEEVWDNYHVTARLCRRCNSYVPMGAYHCEFCDVCIQDMDHHCPWIGKCVGKYSLGVFYCFLTSVVVNIIGVGVLGGVCAVMSRPT